MQEGGGQPQHTTKCNGLIDRKLNTSNSNDLTSGTLSTRTMVQRTGASLHTNGQGPEQSLTHEHRQTLHMELTPGTETVLKTGFCSAASKSTS